MMILSIKRMSLCFFLVPSAPYYSSMASKLISLPGHNHLRSSYRWGLQWWDYVKDTSSLLGAGVSAEELAGGREERSFFKGEFRSWGCWKYIEIIGIDWLSHQCGFPGFTQTPLLGSPTEAFLFYLSWCLVQQKIFGIYGTYTCQIFRYLKHLALLQGKTTLSDSYSVQPSIICLWDEGLSMLFYISILLITITIAYVCIYIIYMSYIDMNIWTDIYVSSDTFSWIAATPILIILFRMQ